MMSNRLPGFVFVPAGVDRWAVTNSWLNWRSF
jgi:hypothetical protein